MEEIKHIIITKADCRTCSPDPNFRSLFAAIDIGRRELILNLQGIWHPYPTRTSIQVGSNHLESEAGACINHSCKPNAEILCVIYSMDPRDKPHFVPESAFAQNATRRPVLVSNQEILKGEEITFDYNKTEDILANPFICNCCGKEIKGKKYG
tara:strand:+ start:70 stop:528 length:459 start_codon:yes stop_codon:yes gene_type:complete